MTSSILPENVNPLSGSVPIVMPAPSAIAPSDGPHFVLRSVTPTCGLWNQSVVELISYHG